MSDLPIRGIFDEWEREETARREQSERLKALFKRAKDDGYNPKAMRQAFAERYALDHFPAAKVAARTSDANDVDLYLAALAGVRTREGDDDLPDHDAETGEIIETSTLQKMQTAPNPALAASNSQAERRPESTEQSAGANADERAPVSSAPIQPETANSSVRVETTTDIGSARDASAMLHPGVVDGPTTIALQAGTVVTAGETATDHPGGDHANSDGKAVASHRPLMQGGAEVARLAHNQEVDGANPSPATSSLTGSAADKSAGPEVSLRPAAPTDHIVDTEKVAPTKLKMNAEFFEEPHPACQRPGFCGGNSAIALCDACKAAAGAAHDGPTFQPEASVH